MLTIYTLEVKSCSISIGLSWFLIRHPKQAYTELVEVLKSPLYFKHGITLRSSAFPLAVFNFFSLLVNESIPWLSIENEVLDRKVSDDMRILKEKYLGKNVQLNHKTN